MKRFHLYFQFLLLVLISSSSLQAQNTLDKVGLTSSTPAATAYSLRLLSSSYTGPLVRITPNAGSNFYDVYPDVTTGGFTQNSKISASVAFGSATAAAGTNTLGSLITAGVTNATVAIWYDQSGYGRNALQGTLSAQPQIINAGVIYTQKGKPTIYFNSQSMNTASFTAYSSGFSLEIVAGVSTNTSASTFGGKANSNIANPWDMWGGYFFMGSGNINNYTQTNLINGINASSGFSQWSFSANSTSAKAYINSIANGSTTGTLSYGDGNNSLYLGTRADGGTQLNGWISEYITFGSVLSTTDRQTVEQNQTNNIILNTLDKVSLTSSTISATAYSLRLLSSQYTGPLVRITTNGGVSYYDVYPDVATGGFTTSSKISASVATYNAAVATVGTNALSSLITAGTTNATVAIWYDQSGNGINMSQSSTSAQPQIITAGVINTLYSKPAITFGTSKLATAQQAIFTAGASMVGVAKGNAASPSAFITKSGTAAGANNNYPSPFDFTNSGNDFYVGNASSQSASNLNLNSSYPTGYISSGVAGSVYSFVVPTTGSFTCYLNGVQSGSQTVTSFQDGGNSMMIGNRNDNSSNGNLTTPEIIMFNAALSATVRQTAEANLAAYYIAPIIATQPSTSTQSVSFGGTTTALSVVASTSYGTISSYQWYSNATNSNSGGTLISGATASSYTAPTTSAGTSYYYVVVTNSVGNTTTSNVSGAITVSKATPTITTSPTASGITYGQTLASSILSGGVASVAGTFAFTSPSTVPSVGTTSQGYTFTPTDVTDYNSQSGTVSVTVNAIAPTLGSFTVAAKNYGDAAFALTAPSSNSAGAFTYTSSNTSVATVSGSTVTIVGAGTSTITATQAANGNYASGTTTATLSE